MFKALKDAKIIAISEKKEVIIHTEDGDIVQEITGEELFPCLVFDEVVEETEHTTSDYVEVNGEYVLVTDDKAIEKKKDNVRSVRNSYLEQYVDPKQLFLVWESLSQDDKQMYIDYRNYLLDYTKEENWWERNPLTLEEWRYASAVTKNDTISDTDDTIN